MVAHRGARPRASGAQAPPARKIGHTARVIRIGTWNLGHERNASPMVLKRQLDFMEALRCDLWLLTEVPYTFRTVMGPAHTALSGDMDRTHKAYAAVWARDGIEQELPRIHEAAAFARVGGRRICSCLLPSPETPVALWPDTNWDRTALLQTAVERLAGGLAGGSEELVWGGDWSHPMNGAHGDAAAADRRMLEATVAGLGLQVASASGVEHVAVPAGWTITSGARLDASDGDGRMSEHDAYVVEVEP